MHTKPNMILVGAGKAGTTSLFRYLDQHARIFGSETKELMFFSQYFGRGVDWYLENFPEQPGVSVYFEATPQYSFRDEFPNVAARIHDFNPNMRILYIVREPFSRIVSHFNHWARTRPEVYTDINEILSQPEHQKIFVNRTKYWYQLSAYLDLFGPEQVKLVFLEDLKTDFIPTLNGIYRFLDVPETADQVDNIQHNALQAKKDVTTVQDIRSDVSGLISGSLRSDVQNLLSYAGKRADFWGDAFLPAK